MSENVRTALITAAAVLFGGLIAGTASIVTTIVNQNGENGRVERRVDEEARGAARVLFSRLSSVSDAMGVMLDEDRYTALVRSLIAPGPSTADLKQVNGRLPADGFVAVKEAMKAARLYDLLLDLGKGQPLDSLGRENVEKMKAAVEEGAAALRAVADLPASTAEASAVGS